MVETAQATNPHEVRMLYVGSLASRALFHVDSPMGRCNGGGGARHGGGGYQDGQGKGTKTGKRGHGKSGQHDSTAQAAHAGLAWSARHAMTQFCSVHSTVLSKHVEHEAE